MVWQFGMGARGYVGDYTIIPETQLSEKVKNDLNEDTKQILDECLKEAGNLLKLEMPLLDRFAKELLDKKELEYDEIEAIFKEFEKQRVVPQLQGLNDGPSQQPKI